eukprot:TRINITY_DN2203_c0_g2_i1.p1 TRINITY_DN2203_c0_g2~~TRINITY_DN2203_c0_g2_i1.p1  ORF type:complete len:359 (+),score=81.19 TRINITY_DN2203_c0_g2_i1:251-1327(+)
MTLNNPRKLNIISSKIVSRIAELFEKWEKDDNAEIIILKGAGRAFSAGGDLRMFYSGRADDPNIEVVYRMYWLMYHLHTYKKCLVSLIHGLAIGGGAGLAVVANYSVATEKAVFSTPEASLGFHTDVGFSYTHSHLPGYVGEYLALTGVQLNAEEMISAGLATYCVPSEKLPELEKQLKSLNAGDKNLVKDVIERFSIDVTLGENKIVKNRPLIDKIFSKDTVEDIINALVEESKIEENKWIKETLKALQRSSPIGLKMTFESIRRGRKEIFAECLKKEFRLTINTLRGLVSEDIYEGIRALIIDKDNSPKWSLSLDQVTNDKIDLLFKPYPEEFELQLPTENVSRWEGKYEDSAYKH